MPSLIAGRRGRGATISTGARCHERAPSRGRLGVRINRSLLGWGVFFVVLGVVPLAVRQGAVPEETVARAWTLWPLLLIFAGIALVLRRTPVAPAASLAMAATFGLIGGGFLASGSIPGVGCGDQRHEVPFQAQSGQLGEAGEVDVQLLCGEL